ASPHVAGAAALLWSAAPFLIGQLDETEQILMKSATPVPHNGCEEGPIPVSPNNTYGYGRLNASAAVSMALHSGVITATVNGVVGPLAGITVTLTDRQTGAVWMGQSNGAGQVVFARIYLGDYTLSAMRGSIGDEMLISIQGDEQKQVMLRLAKTYYFPHILAPETVP
ncbi:MAG: hypothetical protein HY328_00845, partial [Chloroflexi bacterium]|nr:hypothetical protein [Chloroflexota bacterium]